MTTLGATYRDKITGFTGVATGYVTYITGCNQVLIAPASTDGSLKSSEWIDEQRLERRPIEIITLDNGHAPGFDTPAPRR